MAPGQRKVEGFMKPMGKATRAAWSESEDWQRKLLALLLKYRNTLLVN